MFENDEVPCVTTRADGTFTLEQVPVVSQHLISFVKDGYVSALRNILVGYVDTGFINITRIVSDARSAEILDAVGITQDDANGAIAFGAATDNTENVDSVFTYTVPDLSEFIMVEGYSAVLDPESGSAAVYADANGEMDPSLDVSSEAGWGFFLNVEPGEYNLTVTHPTMNCGNPVSVRVVAGFVTTNVGPYCAPL